MNATWYSDGYDAGWYIGRLSWRLAAHTSSSLRDTVPRLWSAAHRPGLMASRAGRYINKHDRPDQRRLSHRPTDRPTDRPPSRPSVCSSSPVLPSVRPSVFPSVCPSVRLSVPSRPVPSVCSSSLVPSHPNGPVCPTDRPVPTRPVRPSSCQPASVPGSAPVIRSEGWTKWPLSTPRV